MCPAIQTRVCNRHIIEAWTAFVMWSSNVCYLFFPIKIPFITYVWLLPNTHIWSKRMKSQNPDCLNISKGTEEKEKTLMIYYSSFIYTTGIDCIGRMLMIVRSFLLIIVDKLLSITLIYSSIKHDVQYHEWRMNFHAHVYWYYVSFYLCVCVYIYECNWL